MPSFVKIEFSNVPRGIPVFIYNVVYITFIMNNIDLKRFLID